MQRGLEALSYGSNIPMSGETEGPEGRYKGMTRIRHAAEGRRGIQRAIEGIIGLRVAEILRDDIKRASRPVIQSRSSGSLGQSRQQWWPA
jgi:hypothetical protein